MINLPAAPAAPAPTTAGAAAAATLPPPAANGAAPLDAAGAGNAADLAATPAAAPAGSGLLDGVVALATLPFGALLDAMAGVAARDEDSAADPAGQADSASGSDAAAAQAVATMLPAIGNPGLAALVSGTPGATPDSVAAVAAALTAPAAAPAAPDGALLVRQQAQANALLARDAAAGQTDTAARSAGAQAETAQHRESAVLAAHSALLAATTRPATGASLMAAAAAVPAPAAAPRPAASEALSAALNMLQSQAADSTAAPLVAKDSASLLADSQQRPAADGAAVPGFRSVLANSATMLGQPGDSLQLSGAPEQWQQPLRAALGDRLQLQLARNDERAVIRLEPPNMGSVEITVRHSGGALQVNIAASHTEVLRQLNNIGDAMRQDLSQRQQGEVAVTVSSSSARNLADGGGQQQRQQPSEQQRQPGRALDEADSGPTTFAMLSERE